MLEAHERGLKEGVEKGRTEGWTEGVVGVAKKLLAKSFSLNEIADITGLTVEQIQNL